ELVEQAARRRREHGIETAVGVEAQHLAQVCARRAEIDDVQLTVAAPSEAGRIIQAAAARRNEGTARWRSAVRMRDPDDVAHGRADVEVVLVGGGRAERHFGWLDEARGYLRGRATVAQRAAGVVDAEPDDGAAGEGALAAVEADVQIAVGTETQAGG